MPAAPSNQFYPPPISATLPNNNAASASRAVPTLRAMRPVQQREVSLPGLRVVQLFMVGSRLARPQQIRVRGSKQMTATEDRLSELRQQLSDTVARVAELEQAAIDAMLEAKTERDISAHGNA